MVAPPPVIHTHGEGKSKDHRRPLTERSWYRFLLQRQEAKSEGRYDTEKIRSRCQKACSFCGNEKVMNYFCKYAASSGLSETQTVMVIQFCKHIHTQW
ncbi:hypothetical protein EMCRGX_G032813 [Ephydatia muelleri]